jgi:hypothetical protein
MRLAETLGALAEARAYVAQSKQWLSQQRAIIEDLESADADPVDEVIYLESLEKMHAQNVEYLVRLEHKVLLLVTPED